MKRRKPITTERGAGGWHERCVKLLRDLGWHVWHDRSKRLNNPDEPDLRCLRERLVMIELKAPGKRLRRGQRDRLLAYAKAGVEAYALWPDDEAAMIDRMARAYGPKRAAGVALEECAPALAALQAEGESMPPCEHEGRSAIGAGVVGCRKCGATRRYDPKMGRWTRWYPAKSAAPSRTEG